MFYTALTPPDLQRRETLSWVPTKIYLKDPVAIDGVGEEPTVGIREHKQIEQSQELLQPTIRDLSII